MQKIHDTSHQQMESSVVARMKQENEMLQNERNGLARKLESLSKETSGNLKEEFVAREKKINSLLEDNQNLINENSKLRKTVQNIKAYNSAKQDEETIQMLGDENKKLKKINGQLLDEIKNLKIQIEIKGDNLYNSRVIELQTELDFIKHTKNSSTEAETKKLLTQINEINKVNAKLKQENQDHQAKLDNQAVIIERLMNENQGNPSKESSNPSTSSKEKSYSERCNGTNIEQLEKYKKKVK